MTTKTKVEVKASKSPNQTCTDEKAALAASFPRSILVHRSSMPGVQCQLTLGLGNGKPYNQISSIATHLSKRQKFFEGSYTESKARSRCDLGLVGEMCTFVL